MELFTQSLQLNIPYPLEELISSEKTFKKEDFLFFDIETTGLSADISSLYIIGCLYYKENEFHMKQWFANEYDSEEEMIHAFFEVVKDHKVLLHYNGNGFDIPYLEKKIAAYGLKYSFEKLESIDLYKRIRPYKKVLNLPNLKQKTMEEYLFLSREDEYSGKELINVYGDYMKKHFAREDNSKELSLLLLHNDEDLKGMVELLSLCYYIDLFHKKHDITSVTLDNDVMSIELSLETALPRKVSYHNEGLSLETKDDKLTLHLLLYKGELKYFYPNYKDYYYLPAEDIAIHKSVAEYVDKAYREKAKKSNCYSKKQGVFLPISEEQAKEENLMVFRNDVKDKQGFMEINEDWLRNRETISEYIYSILYHIR